MAGYNLEQGEMILYKVENVHQKKLDTENNVLIATNKNLIYEKRGLFNQFKGVVKYNYNDITQVVNNEYRGDRTIEVHLTNGSLERFIYYYTAENKVNILIKAIEDSKESKTNPHNMNYYKSIENDVKENKRLMELQNKANNSVNVSGLGVASNLIRGKGIKKALTGKSDSLIGGIIDNVLDDFGVHDIQDSFTELENDIREDFGLKTKMTHAERRELEELQEKQRKKEMKRKNDEIINKSNSKTEDKTDKFDMLKKAKELLDAGILTQEEFEEEKKKILDKD